MHRIIVLIEKKKKKDEGCNLNFHNNRVVGCRVLISVSNAVNILDILNSDFILPMYSREFHEE